MSTAIKEYFYKNMSLMTLSNSEDKYTLRF